MSHIMETEENRKGFERISSLCERGGFVKPLSQRALVGIRLIDLFNHNNLSDIQNHSVLLNPDSLEVDFGSLLPKDDMSLSLPDGSGWDEKGYALAVNLSWVLTGVHPYKGSIWFETPLITPKIEENIFTSAEYVFATDSKAPNAPNRFAQPNAITLFNTLTKELKVQLKSGFGRDSSPWFSDREPLDASTAELRHILWEIVALSKPANSETIKVVIDGHDYVLAEGKRLILPSTAESIGHVERGFTKKGKMRLALVNDSLMEWERPGWMELQTKVYSPGENVILEDGMEFQTEGDCMVITKSKS